MRDGKVIRVFQVHCAGNCSTMTEFSSKSELLAHLRARKGYSDGPWELVDGRWYCGRCAGWKWVCVRDGRFKGAKSRT